MPFGGLPGAWAARRWCPGPASPTPCPGSPRPSWTACPCWSWVAAFAAIPVAPSSSTTWISRRWPPRSPRVASCPSAARRSTPPSAGPAVWRARDLPARSSSRSRPTSISSATTPPSRLSRRRRRRRPPDRAPRWTRWRRRPARAAGAGADRVALAEKLQAVVASTFQGKGAFPEEHPLFLWPGFGQAAPAFVRKVVADCDLTLALGCRFGEGATASYGLPPPQPLIHVDIDPGVLGRNYPAALGVTADAASLVRELLPRLPPRAPNDAVRRSIGEGQRAVWRDWEGR